MTPAIQVIGAGWGRTGTDSLRAALDILGFGPCHHMLEVRGNPAQQAAWLAAARGGDLDWGLLLGGYRSCVDWPSAFYWRELMLAFPQATVILTLRPVDSWWKSFSETILAGWQAKPDPNQMTQWLIGHRVMQDRAGDRDFVMGLYQAHLDAVRAAVPPARLLELNLGDGWTPLCAHLRVPVPDVPYPVRNSTEVMQRRMGLAPPPP